MVPPTNFWKVLVWLDRLNLVIVDSSVHEPCVFGVQIIFSSLLPLSISYRCWETVVTVLLLGMNEALCTNPPPHSMAVPAAGDFLNPSRAHRVLVNTLHTSGVVRRT